MLQKVRENLALVLLALLPFHAFLVTVLTKMIVGEGHPPLTILALWKEAILGIILLCALADIFRPVRNKKGQWSFDPLKSVDLIDGCILIAAFWASKVPYWFRLPILTPEFIFGFKYDFIPLIAFFILRRVQWSPDFLKRATKILLGSGVIIAVYGIISAFLPLGFFTSLGYSGLHSLYSAEGPLAAFQQIGGTSIRRIQSVMSGPNQLGLWLLIPIGILLSQYFGKKAVSGQRSAVSFGILLVALVMTFSRAAWIAFIVMAIVVIVQKTPKLHRKKIAFGALGLIPCAIIVALLFPSVFLRIQSSSDHFRKPVEAVDVLLKHPLGLGLGTAGPASNATSETCVQLEGGSDITWAKDRPDLCVFVAGIQMQPADHACDCPVLTENWYLQWAVEMGWVGLVVSLMLPFFILRKRIADSDKRIVILSYIGLSVAGLFLHAFEDAAVAYTIWILLAISLPETGTKKA